MLLRYCYWYYWCWRLPHIMLLCWCLYEQRWKQQAVTLAVAPLCHECQSHASRHYVAAAARYTAQISFLFTSSLVIVSRYRLNTSSNRLHQIYFGWFQYFSIFSRLRFSRFFIEQPLRYLAFLSVIDYWLAITPPHAILITCRFHDYWLPIRHFTLRLHFAVFISLITVISLSHWMVFWCQLFIAARYTRYCWAGLHYYFIFSLSSDAFTVIISIITSSSSTCRHAGFLAPGQPPCPVIFEPFLSGLIAYGWCCAAAFQSSFRRHYCRQFSFQLPPSDASFRHWAEEPCFRLSLFSRQRRWLRVIRAPLSLLGWLCCFLLNRSLHFISPRLFHMTLRVPYYILIPLRHFDVAMSAMFLVHSDEQDTRCAIAHICCCELEVFCEYVIYWFHISPHRFAALLLFRAYHLIILPSLTVTSFWCYIFTRLLVNISLRYICFTVTVICFICFITFFMI